MRLFLWCDPAGKAREAAGIALGTVGFGGFVDEDVLAGDTDRFVAGAETSFDGRPVDFVFEKPQDETRHDHEADDPDDAFDKVKHKIDCVIASEVWQSLGGRGLLRSARNDRKKLIDRCPCR